MFDRKTWILLLTLSFIQFSHIVDFMIMMPLGDSLMRAFSISPQEFSLLVTSYTVCAGVMGIMASVIADRFDRKKLLLFFYIGFGVGTVACGLAESYHSLLIARALTGGFGGVLNAIVIAIASDSTPPEKRATALGTISTAFSLASIVGVPLSIFVANKFDWHAPFIGLGVLSLALTFLIQAVVPTVTAHIAEARKSNQFTIVLHFFTEKSNVSALTFAFILVCSQMTIIPFIAPTLLANVKLTQTELPLIYLVGGLTSILAAPLVGWAADRFGRLKVFLIATTFSVIPIFILTNLGPTSLWFVLFSAGIFFVALSGRMTPAMAILSSHVSPAKRGAFMSFVVAVQQFAAGAGSFIGGMMIVRTDSGEYVNYPSVGLVSVGLAVVAMILSLQFRTKLPLKA